MAASRRAAVLLLTVLAGAMVVFFAMKAAPGDPALSALGENARPELVAAFRRLHNLDLPVGEQFATWISGALRGDFGRSLTLAGGVPVGQLIAGRLPVTAFIGLYALILAGVISMIVGTVAALSRGTALDTLMTSFAVLGVSMPDFWLGYVLVFFLALNLPIFPSYGFVSPSDSLPGALLSGFLPALAIAAPMAAVFSRVLRAALLEVMHRPYVQVQRSLGLSSSFVFLHTIFRNALIPYVTIIGLQVRYLLGGVVVIERVFGIPGIGSLMVDGAFGRDYPVIQACALTFLVIVLGTNLLVDLLCARLDPKARGR
ncbi:peptide/nickel transport system permease protein [Humitalea rosea]|uniref:Peptide/nickel transport system permease protein n=1 Tax=Humitalea rosea TaxID=990373 RepID=A0A2W7ILD4_9PROT|nr:ABC transporter permease [Humitalea rosea]PZW46817.1 peptide/nickel transport system permease protein [Humitalea rosea]